MTAILLSIKIVIINTMVFNLHQRSTPMAFIILLNITYHTSATATTATTTVAAVIIIVVFPIDSS